MKKITIILILLLTFFESYSQIVNEPANWPNTDWSIEGNNLADPTVFVADPTLTANFSYNDDNAGSTSDDEISAASPIIDLTAAANGGETWLTVSGNYVHRYLSYEYLIFQYWDADNATWIDWGAPFAETTNGAPFDDFCAGTGVPYTSDVLNIFNFTATQLSGFKYRIYYNDNLNGSGWNYGFCFESPTLTSETPPACPNVSVINVTNITATTADITWAAGNSESAWEVAVQPVDTGEPTGSGDVATTNSFTATGLSAVTEYEVYVRANCDADGFSNWEGPVNFMTACDVFVPFYLEDFSAIIPNCWDEADNGTAATGPLELGSGSWTSDGFLNNGFEGAYKINLYASSKSDWILSPKFDLTGGPFQVDFDFGIMKYGSSTLAGTLGSDDTVQLLISTDNGVSWTGLVTYDNTSVVPASGIQVVYDLSAYAGQIVQFGILASEGTASDTADNDVFVDNFRVREIPTCQEPSDLTVTNITDTTADLGWTANGSATSWEVLNQVAGSGTPTASDSGNATSDNPFQVTGLAASTNYEFYVRSVCGTDEVSLWFGPYPYRISGPGEVCENPLIVTTPLPYLTSDNTSNYNDDYDGTAGTDCGSTYPYLNGDDVVYAYTPDVDTSIDIEVSELTDTYAGVFVYTDCADIGTNCQTGAINQYWSDDLIIDDLTVTGGTTYYIVISTWSTPQSTGYTLSIRENTCIDPQASYQIVDDCDNGEQFLVDVNVTDLGDAESLTISNNIDANTVSVPATGIYQAGPFPFGTDVIISIDNDQDGNCFLNETFQIMACPPANDNPCDATVVEVNEDSSCDLSAPGTLLEGTPSGIPAASCAGTPNDDVWYQFTALNNYQIIQLNNLVGAGFFPDLDHVVYSGTCDNLIELYCSDGEASITPELTVGDTYFVRVFSASNIPVDYTFDICIKPGTGNVSVNQDQYTVEEIVTDVLINSPCAQVSNITFSTGTDFGSSNGIGYFYAEEGSFPFTEGLLLTTGDASNAAGPNFDTLSDGFDGNWGGDPDLDVISGEDTNNATIIEFDFIPLANEISFDFLMASEEYDKASFECEYSDAFAFLLTDEDGVTTNLAVLPNTTTPILVTNIHPDNGYCGAVNEAYFGGYTPDGLPPTNFDGQTAVFTAYSQVNLGQTYHIKLVIADARDTAYDSGVFLKAGSFDIGQIDLGEDITIEAGTATCADQPVTIQTTALNVEHVWYKDGFQIDEETSNELIVTEAGTYTVQIIFSAQCNVSDEILIEFLPLPQIAETPPNLVGCSIGDDTAEFTLEDNDLNILSGVEDTNNYTITYHINEQDAKDGINALESPYTSVSNPQTIYALVKNNTTGCKETASFDLVLGTQPETTFTEDFDYEVCPDAVKPIMVTATAVNYQPSEVTIQWFRDGQASAITGQNGLSLPVLEGDIYTIVVTFNDTGCSTSQDIEVITLETCVIPQGISPNADGKNDTFDLSSFNVNSVEIFNRYGTLVFEKNNSYIDEWYGQSKDGKELPVGTYFYSIRMDDGEHVTGWVYLQRKN